MEDVLKDDRFAIVAKDPRFRRQKRENKQFKVDKRFGGMFKENRFKVKYTVDKRGRPFSATTDENLKKFYQLEKSDEESSDDEDDGDKKMKITKKKKSKSLKKEKVDTAKTEDDEDNDGDDESIDDGDGSMGEEDIDSESSVEPQAGCSKKTSSGAIEEDESDSESDVDSDSSDEGYDLARGEGNVETSESDSSDSDSENDDRIYHKWNEMDSDLTMREDATSRLAVCDLNWDRIKSKDILVMLNSFLPPGGIIKSVTIYPSEFGMQRMKEEEINGPPEFKDLRPSKVEDGEEDRDPHNMEILRKYQMNRFKYYYAVVECDNEKTANHVYEECDGIEQEHTGTRLDLRFIPEDMTFDQKPHNMATSADLSNYKPSTFVTSALQQAKVSLTWEEDDKDRTAMLKKKKFTQEELEEIDFKDYLASDSSCDEDAYAGLNPCKFPSQASEDKQESIKKYKSLLLGDNDGEEDDSDEDEKDEDLEMEITWDSGVAGTSSELQQTKKEAAKSEWQKFLEEKRNKKKGSKEKDDLEANIVDDDEYRGGVELDDPLNDKIWGDKDSKEKKKLKRKRKYEQEEISQDDKANLEMLMDTANDDKQHFNLDQLVDGNKPLSKKAKRRMLKEQKEQQKSTEDTFKMNYKDSRFERLFTDSSYNIDPSASHFKKTKAMEGLVDEKLKRRQMQQSKQNKKKEKVLTGPQKEELELDSLVKSLKSKAEKMGKNKKHNIKKK